MSTRSLVLPFCTPSTSGRVFCFSIKFGRVTSLACIQGWRLRARWLPNAPLGPSGHFEGMKVTRILLCVVGWHGTRGVIMSHRVYFLLVFLFSANRLMKYVCFG